MDDGASPQIGLIVLCAAAAVVLLYLFWKRWIAAEREDVTEEEIISMVKEGHEQGVLEANEAEMIHNIFEFDDKEAKDIMTHRKHIIALDGTMTFKEAMDFIKKHGGKTIKFMSIIAAPEGVERLTKAHPDIQLYVGHLDRELNEDKYICPGLGDAGDRIFGTK